MYIILFFVFLLVSLPMVFVSMSASVFDLLFNGGTGDLILLIRRLFNGIHSFAIMAIPFFILAGELMGAAGITVRILNFAKSLVGHLRGGLAQVNILSAVMLAGGSGSAAADASAIGSMMIPAMEKSGYSKKFSAAITIVSAVIVPIIPPSGTMIVYAVATNTSIAGMFAGAIVPGILLAIMLMCAVAYVGKKRNLPVSSKKAPREEVIKSFKSAFFPLLTPILLLGGIFSGIFTPTEAAAVTALYTLCLGIIYKTITLKNIGRIFFKAAKNSAVILLLIATAMILAAVVSLKGTVSDAGDWISTVTQNKYLMLFIINIFLLVVGALMDSSPAMLILGPIFAPIVANLGVDPVHFGVIFSVNMVMGQLTPPVGLLLFVASGLTKINPEQIAKELWPIFYIVDFVFLMIITFIPQITLFLPHFLNISHAMQ